MVGFRVNGGGELVCCIIQQPNGTIHSVIDSESKGNIIAFHCLL